MAGSSAVAIVGVSVELPSGEYSPENLDHASFFDFLLNSGEAYQSIPAGRFNVEAWKGNSLGTIHVDKGAFLKDIDLFDNVEFGISSRDAQCMAPATKKLLENSFLALLDSGIDYRMKSIGCYTSGTSIELTNVSEPDEFEARGSFGGYPSMIANRISNHLDLLGPSLPVDTACSSTLTATHLAVQALLNDECEAAVVAGCQLNHRFIDWVLYSQGSLLAKDGKCKPFDSSADGFSRAEGCAAIVIKPLENAIRDHDRIYATILGTAINSTGSAAPPGAPVAESQRDAMVEAFRRAGKSPQEVDFVELHATGTAKGDPTEANWVGSHFQREDELLVGSVKGNIGHTEITAFLASLSKVLSILQHNVIPPTVNLETLNPAIKWSEYRLRAPVQPEPLACRSGDKSLISIACSGIGGSNGHVVLESAPVLQRFSDGQRLSSGLPILLVSGGLSGKTVTTIAEWVQQQVVQEKTNWPGLSTILGRRAKQMTWRSFSVLEDISATQISFSAPQHSSRGVNPLVFVFSGQGPQHKDMGRQLFSTFPAFRQSILEMDEVFRRLTNKSIIHDLGLFAGACASDLPDIWPISLVLPSIAIFQMALFDLLRSLGVNPDFVIGHSAGETSVLYASGAAPKAMAVELAIIRGQCFTQIEPQEGTMAAVSCSVDEAEELLFQYRSEHPESIVELACYNSPSAVAIAGHEAAIDVVVKMAEATGVFARKIRTRVPIHSSMMESCREEYATALQDLFARYPGPHKPVIPMYSTLTGEVFEDSFDASYFWKSTRFPVRFTQAMAAMKLAVPVATFAEITPHPVLVSYILSMVDESSVILPTVHRPKRGASSTEYKDILNLLGKLTVNGHNCVDFTALNNRACYETEVMLPNYPFVKKKYPLYPDTPGFLKQIAHRNGPINHQYLRINKDTHPTLGEHIIRGEPIMPAAGFLEMAIEFGATTLMNVNLRSILSLSSEKPVKVDVTLDGSFWSVKSIISSRSRKDAEVTLTERLHADGYLSRDPPPIFPDLDIVAIRNRCPSQVYSGFYSNLSYFSTYGPKFQRVTNIYYGLTEALVSLKGLDQALADEGNYFLHPAILDACVQISAYKPFHGDFNPNAYYLPEHLDAVIVHQPLKPHYFPPHLYAHVELKEWLPDGMRYDVALVDDLGGCLCTFQGLRVAKHQINPSADPSDTFEIALQPLIPAKRVPLKPFSNYKHRDTLFKGLDNIILKAENPSELCCHKIYEHKVCEHWPTYATILANRNHKGLVSSSEGPQFDNVINSTIQALADALSHLSLNRKRVAHVLVISNYSPALNDELARVTHANPTLFVDLHLDHKINQSLPVLSRGMVRPVDVSFSNEGAQNVEDGLFDVVLAFNIATTGVEPEVLIKKCNAFLAPGGSLIVADRNHEAWEQHTPGTVWYNTVFGEPSTNLYSLKTYLDNLRQVKSSVIRVQYNPLIDPFYFTIESQKNSWSENDARASPLYVAEESFTFDYVYGQEADLQWEFSGLNVLQKLDIWILAKEGRDGWAAIGLVRALRKEYLAWTMRLVIFPTEFDQGLRQKTLETLPSYVTNEPDIIVPSESFDGLLVPRIAPMLPPKEKQDSRLTLRKNVDRLPIDQIKVRILSYSTQGSMSGFVASVNDSNNTGLKEDSVIIGLTLEKISPTMLVDITTTYPLSEHLIKHASAVAALLPGFVAAILAPGLSTFSRLGRLSSLRILLTNSDSVTGLSIASLYSYRKLVVTEVVEKTSLLDLAGLKGAPFDLIISGYGNKEHIQVLKTLLRPGRGKFFTWGNDNEGLQSILSDPCAVGDALQYSMSLMEGEISELALPSELLGLPGQTLLDINKPMDLRATFDPRKTYLLLGGIGTLGAHLSLFMYQRGARHIVLTSRSGKKSLESNANLVIRRMFKYLDSLEDLNLRYEAADAISGSSMKSLVETISPVIGGCMILTGILIDRVFQDLSEEEFGAVCSSKTGVFDVMKEYLDLPTLEFVIGFSSVSGLFGTGGQTNYDAANTALEGEISLLRNGFSFICPAIIDSTMMLAGAEDGKEARLSYLLEWSFSAEDMIRWFDDAMYKFQNGSRFSRYIPTLSWEIIDRVQAMPRVGKHLVPTKTSEVTNDKNDSDRMADIIRTVLGISADDFSPDVPFTAYGIDSLSASRISFQLRSIVEVTQIQLLANLCLHDLQRMKAPDEATVEDHARSNNGPVSSKSKTDTMIEVVARYTDDMEASSTTTDSILPVTPVDGEIVLVTGTTGSLGCHILQQLLATKDITRVYAFNRPKAGSRSLLERQKDSLEKQGLSPDLADSSKLILIEGDLAADDYGVAEEILSDILSSVTHIIHNAWTVDFMISLAEYDDLIKGTRRLLDLAKWSALPSPPTFSYISTFAVFHHRKDNFHVYAEEPLLDPRVASSTGYLESKWVAERIVQIAGEKYGLKTNVIRAGVLTGGTSNGAWEPSQWVPALIQSGAYLGCLPEGDSLISWIPLDVAAAAIVDLRTTTDDTLHVVHPRPVTWNDVMKPVAKILGLPLVPYVEWLSRLESSVSSPQVGTSESKINTHGALRLTDFFRLGLKNLDQKKGTESMALLPRVANEKGVAASQTLQRMQEEMQEIGERDVRKWLEHWRGLGILPTS